MSYYCADGCPCEIDCVGSLKTVDPFLENRIFDKLQKFNFFEVKKLTHEMCMDRYNIGAKRIGAKSHIAL